MNFYSKPYTSLGGLRCRMWYHFSINLLFDKKIYDKLYGYSNWYYDGYIHNFNIYPIRIDWLKRGEVMKTNGGTCEG